MLPIMQKNMSHALVLYSKIVFYGTIGLFRFNCFLFLPMLVIFLVFPCILLKLRYWFNWLCNYIRVSCKQIDNDDDVE